MSRAPATEPKRAGPRPNVRAARRRRLRWAWIATVLLACAALAAWLVQLLQRHVWGNWEPVTLLWEEHTIRLLQPEALSLVLLVPFVLAAQLLQRTDFSAFQLVLNALLRVALVLALTATLARPSTSQFSTSVCVAWVVDVSESVPDPVLEQAHTLVQAAHDAKGGERMVLVTVAGRPIVRDLPPPMGRLAPIARHSDELEPLSDPAAGVRLALGLCPQNAVRRLVLVTDGNENRGDLLAEAARAAELGIPIHVHRIPFEPPAEVAIRDLLVPDDVRLSEPFNMTAVLFSTRTTTARLDLTQNGFRDIRGRVVELTPGRNEIALPVEVYEPGLRRFTLTVRPDDTDRFEENNTYVRTLTVTGRPRVLYVEGESRARQYLQRALDRERNDLANFDLEVRGSTGFPTTLEEMQAFSVILLSDVPAQFLSRTAMNALGRWVREGGGLILIGGENSFGPGGYDNTPIEELSPVTFDLQRQRNQPSLAITLVIDRSGSMDGQKIEMVKEAARAVVDLLGPQDQVSVIAFDDRPDTVVRMQSASNRARIRADIGRIAPGGGTDILPALTQAYVDLLGTPARIRHVIVLTDGQAPWNGIADVTSRMRADGITVSSVAVGREADRTLLEMIAELGGGRFHATNDPSNVPQIFVQETSEVARTNLIEEPFRPIAVRRSQATAGIPWDSVPYLLGYVKTEARSSAEVLLESEQRDPILARWRQGVGRVAAFTSDAKNRWSVEWVRSRYYPQFWAQLVRDMMYVQSEETFALHATMDQGEAVLVTDAIGPDDRFVNGLQSVANLEGPDGQRLTVPLRAVGPGRYEGRTRLPAFGPWRIEVEHALDGRQIAVSPGSVTWPYADEYQVVAPDLALLVDVAALTGGVPEPTPAMLWDPLEQRTESRQEWWPRVLLFALGIFLLDLLLRRIRLFGRRVVSWDRVRPQG